MYLLPEPQFIKTQEKTFRLYYDAQICIGAISKTAYHSYAKWLCEEIRQDTGFEWSVTCKSADAAVTFVECGTYRGQEYEIKVHPDGIFLYASEETGMLYAVQTLRQIIRQNGAVIPCMEIHDYPDTAVRGLYYDVSRSRIPTLAYLKKLVDTLAFYKINQFQLYIEHTFLFAGLSEVWRDDTPLTSDDILELDAYCMERNIELVPSIATFGHMYKILRSRSYRHLCEREDLCGEPFGFVDRMVHHTIDVSNEESFTFIRSLIDAYMPLFHSDKFNICGDETMDLGTGKSKALADQLGEETMYMSYVKRLCTYLVEKGKTPMFWGDIIVKFPDAIKQLPKETICLNWGYEADVTEEGIKKLYEAGARLYNCPGVSGWDQFVNQIEKSYINIKKMCMYGRIYQVEGILNTDWGDCGHVNHPDMGICGLIYGAAMSWNSSELPEYEAINRAISVIEYADRSGRFVSEIADISKLWAYKWRNLVNYKENREAAWEPQTLADMKQSVGLLEEKKEQLAAYIASMDGTKRAVILPYLVAVDGMILLQKIGMMICDRAYKQGLYDKQARGKLAEQIENWLYYYKKEWRKVSRESELARVQEVFFWIADRLRDEE